VGRCGGLWLCELVCVGCRVDPLGCVVRRAEREIEPCLVRRSRELYS